MIARRNKKLTNMVSNPWTRIIITIAKSATMYGLKNKGMIEQPYVDNEIESEDFDID